DTPLHFECVQAGTFCVSTDHAGKLEAVARRLYMTPRDMERTFGKAKLSDATRRMLARQPYAQAPVWHFCRDEGEGVKPVKSWWWEEGGREFLRESGFYEMPFFFTVWHEGATPYGSGPGDECLADARQMDILERRKLAGLGKLVDPPVTCPMHLKDILDLAPGGINFSPSPDVIRPILDLAPYAQAMAHIQNEIQTVAARLSEGLMASIFASTPIEMRPKDMSATEFLERKREALQQLGPVISAYEPNVLTPLLFRTLMTLERASLLPPPPQALAGMPLAMKVDFISPMANALRQTASEATRALLEDVGRIYQISQRGEIFDKLDLDQLVDELATGLGAPGSIIRSDADVAAIRSQRNAQAEEQRRIAGAMDALQMTRDAQEIAARNAAMNGMTEALDGQSGEI
ncbi:MAG: portal protein, partial [Ruminococcus flavefaciens]|nr:portal protein [Ruminococcus flavefaciens]